MITINTNSKLVKIYEFLTGNVYTSDKPQSIYQMVWHLILVILFSPFLAIYGFVERNKNIRYVTRFTKRITRIFTVILVYSFFNVLGLMMLSDSIVEADGNFWKLYEMFGTLCYFIGALAWIIIFGIVIIAFEVCLLLARVVTLSWKFIIKKLFKNKKTEKKKSIIESSMKRKDWIAFIKGKICPRINWKEVENN